jgi:hypothetical protein
MVRAQGGQGVQLMEEKQGVLLCSDEHPINLLQGGLRSFIAPREQSDIHVYLLKRRLVEKLAKLPHPSRV